MRAVGITLLISGLALFLVAGYQSTGASFFNVSELELVQEDEVNEAAEEVGGDSDPGLTPEVEEEVVTAPSDLPLDEEFVIADRHREVVEETVDGTDYVIEEPTRIQIPSIGVDAPISNVGILENGEMGVPEAMDEVGWFEPGFSPGEQGNSVLAGHVDSRTGPAVFFDLEQLVEGDEITVIGDEGQELVFEVVGKQTYPYDNAPIQTIFGPSDGRNLNLITCTGTFNRDARTHEDRLVVFTQLKDGPDDTQEPSDRIAQPSNVTVQGGMISWHAVRDDSVIGYRVYRKDGNGWIHIESRSAHERKSIYDEESASNVYAVTAVDVNGIESRRSAPSLG
ncbi:class F sortase [Paenalkalicoccus suaedae]|uniref:Class F sortase n=1 Tax=Paenalkalicoccus suaedae TaxID=2592382 RepID=A0A859FHN9_9BACI|nr:class F sortase [Paenalkalicoccus suaedae]QKS72873.1 class F sortase [Paenalkalicoccus suaedae]